MQYLLFFRAWRLQQKGSSHAIPAVNKIIIASVLLINFTGKSDRAMLKFPGRINTDDALILLILLIGALLRFYRLPDIPFTHDEFSAIIRSQFDTFSDLIDKGVKIDGHPAGVQVFLYYLIRIFGVSEVVLKTPFILFGLCSVWLIYLIGKSWFNPTVGLVAASFVSFLQFPVMYSQIARPYASGLCFSLMMVWFWTNVVFHPDRKRYLNLAGLIISAALCAYNHHFSMLFAAMVWITGLFYCSRYNLRSYLVAGLLVFVLYIPHLPIFFYQLGVGGVEGWLQKPRFDFIFDFIQYIFQFSVFIYLLIFLLISLSLLWYESNPRVNRKFILISIIWFLLPWLVGYIYSISRNSVLQYSVLIFSFPFLLFILFGYFKTDRPLHKVILVSVIALIVIPSLIVERKHYPLFYKSPYREIVAESKHAVDSLGVAHCAVILDTKKEVNPYYLDKLNCRDLPFRYLESAGGRGLLLNYLDSLKSNYLIFGCLSSTPWESYSLVMEKFPYLIQHKPYCGGDFYIFSRIKPAMGKDEYFYEVINNFEPSLPEWGWVNEKRCVDSLAIEGTRSYISDAGLEFSPTYSMPLRDLMHTSNDVIDVSVDLRTPPVFPGAWLVVSVTSNGKDIKWSSAAVNDYVKPGSSGRVFQSLRLSDIELRHHGLIFSAFIWNPMKAPYIIDHFRVRIRSGNPMIYGLYREVK